MFKQYITITLILCGISLSNTSQARMYQWIDPNTGTTQLSGKPPSWYRGTQKGPRIYVIEKGRVIDDTGIKLVDEERRRLREEAFSLATQESETNPSQGFTAEP